MSLWKSAESTLVEGMNCGFGLPSALENFLLEDFLPTKSHKVCAYAQVGTSRDLKATLLWAGNVHTYRRRYMVCRDLYYDYSDS